MPTSLRTSGGIGSPAGAGIDLISEWRQVEIKWFPRRRGDRPHQGDVRPFLLREVPPQARG